MASLESFLDDLLARGRAYFSRDEVAAALGLKPSALAAAITRGINKRRLANPRHGFYLILRPEDQIAGAPDPVKWIDPLMKHQGIDYRVSLLRAAAFHGASHQASMVFQVVVPRQLRDFDLGRHRLQFVTRVRTLSGRSIRKLLVDQMKSDAGFATVAGVELTLLDCMRYFHKAAGINGVAQIVKDIGAKASPRLLAEGGRRLREFGGPPLGYLLDLAGHARQADALQGFVKRARTALPLDLAVRPIVKALAQADERNPKWKLWSMKRWRSRKRFPPPFCRRGASKAPWPDLRQVEQDLIISRAGARPVHCAALKGKIAFAVGRQFTS